MPTGMVSSGEDACEAVVREVMEETGVEVEVLSLLSFREAHAARRMFMTGTSNIFMVFLCRPKKQDQPIVLQESEIAACQWMDTEDYLRRMADLMPPSSVYYVLSELGVLAQRGEYTGMDIRQMPIGFRPGHNRVYMYPSKSNL